MYLATYKDPGSVQWTKTSPTKPILERLVTFARASEQHLLQLIEQGAWSSVVNWKTIFKTPLEGFNVWIILKEDVLPFSLARQAIYRRSKKALQRPLTKEEEEAAAKKKEEARKGKKKGKRKTPSQSLSRAEIVEARKKRRLEKKKAKEPKSEGRKNLPAPVIGLNPVELYVRDLRQTFSSLAHFFYDSHGGALIAVSWKTEMKTHTKFAPSKSAYTMPVEMDKNQKIKLVAPNLPEIVADMHRLGEGLVDTIHTDYESFQRQYNSS